jgi:iron complex outermembrane receptor protein
LPYISPIAYKSALNFEKNNFSSEVSVVGNAKQTKFAAVYGETETPAFALLNLNVGYELKFDAYRILTKAG